MKLRQRFTSFEIDDCKHKDDPILFLQYYVINFDIRRYPHWQSSSIAHPLCPQLAQNPKYFGNIKLFRLVCDKEFVRRNGKLPTTQQNELANKRHWFCHHLQPGCFKITRVHRGSFHWCSYYNCNHAVFIKMLVWD